MGQIFVKNAKNGPRILFEQPKSDKNSKSENAEILVNNVKSGLFGHSERQNSAVFQESDLKFCTPIHRQVFVYRVSHKFVLTQDMQVREGKLGVLEHFSWSVLLFI